MTALHIATAAVVKVSIGSPSGNSVASFVRRGDLLPDGVDEAQLKRLTERGFIAKFDAPEPEPEPETFSAADIAAAVKAAEDAKDAELAQAKTDLATARAEFEAQQAEAKKSTPAAKAPAKQQA